MTLYVESYLVWFLSSMEHKKRCIQKVFRKRSPNCRLKNKGCQYFVTCSLWRFWPCSPCFRRRCCLQISQLSSIYELKDQRALFLRGPFLLAATMWLHRRVELIIAMGRTTMQILFRVPLAPVHWTTHPKNIISLSMGMSPCHLWFNTAEDDR